MAAREMHKAVCAECGQDREVTFKPDLKGPVHYRECYSRQRNQGRRY